LFRWLLRPVAAPGWDRLLWASGLVAAAGIALAMTSETISELSLLVSLTLLSNGPYSPLLPISYEPILMTFGQLYHPVLVGALGVAGTLAVEYVNYRLYGAAIHSRPLTALREHRVARRVAGWFRAQPFLTVVVVAFTPIPFWIARILASMTRYSIPRYLVAIAIGRFPRLVLYAAVGLVIPFTAGQILLVGLVLTAILAVAIALKTRRRLSEVGASELGAP
jgi:uncharacterized membrane protein YdjX (TVP38/TMEM64 family)